MFSVTVLRRVSRFYGGIQLGPDRFKHINNQARLLLANLATLLPLQVVFAAISALPLLFALTPRSLSLNCCVFAD